MKCAIIGPMFFGYLADIATRFSGRAIPTVFYDERPSNSVINKLFVRFAPTSVRDHALAKHIDRLVERIIADGTTEVLLVSIEVITPAAVKTLKAAGIRVSLFMWDSLANKAGCRALLKQMDGVASFDPVDCEKYGFTLIPLYSAAPKINPAPTKTHDVFYCTTLHSNRPQLLMSLRKEMDKGGWSAKLFLFYHSRLLWMIRYFCHPQVWPLLALVSTKSFSQTDIATATQRAHVVIDIHHGAQSGLTMRTFEALSLDTVLLTTNPHVLGQLPPALHDRIVALDMTSLSGCLSQAISRRPTPLTPDLSYALSVDRFLNQIDAFVKGEPVPMTFSTSGNKGI